MRKTMTAATALYLLLGWTQASAVPSFARQTGLSCNVCHNNPPQLTAFGRDFKLRGYVLAKNSAKETGNTKDLSLTKNIPISALILLSNTVFQSTAKPAMVY